MNTSSHEQNEENSPQLEKDNQESKESQHHQSATKKMNLSLQEQNGGNSPQSEKENQESKYSQHHQSATNKMDSSSQEQNEGNSPKSEKENQELKDSQHHQSAVNKMNTSSQETLREFLSSSRDKGGMVMHSKTVNICTQAYLKEINRDLQVTLSPQKCSRWDHVPSPSDWRHKHV
ncbi:transcription factor SPT20 homolog isoform X11 [Triplophysa dalaica]|uniref:transcription factor SPT20 homolog isoform X11 n=1 Tax=Triplophysa dalaica TaxID=1582913 RepID=UPI0024E001F8|nr:transcription factor SPT20 homolog isoform X11 [Triplophysa dalaica]